MADPSTQEVEPSTMRVVYKLRDRSWKMTQAWIEHFKEYPDQVEVSSGDIFKEDAPAADALVSPANSFGFMDGGIDGIYSLHFGWQMQERLQKVIRKDHQGELLVGNAVIIPTFEGGAKQDSMKWNGFNGDQPIKFLISVPTMRVPLTVADTVNAYLAFRAVILAVKKHNADPANDPITSVLCPGLGTAVGKMPAKRCAYQMLRAFESCELGKHEFLRRPDHLEDVWRDHQTMTEYKGKV